uniref:DMI1 n=1 Tax=Dumortiera hirsuta TaxID=56917 RepID=E8ZA36_DUMHI|nr:DMI1 [Dumortiera hirsuta]
MELDIAKMEFDFMGTSVICRSGSPLIMADLKKVSVSKARAIIVLAEVENADQSDARVLRVVLSLTGVKEGLRGHVVVELSDLDNEQLVKLVGGDLVETVVAHDVIGRLMIQCARQPGLAQIWEDILGFDNAEFYVKRWPQLNGKRFEEVLLSFLDAIPCGVKVAADNGNIILNPDDDYVMAEGDELLVIAEDDDTYSPGQMPTIRKGSLPKVVSPPKLPEKILFCGWRRDIDDMILVLEAFLAQGSELWMFSEVPVSERETKLMDGGMNPHMLVNITLVHREGNAVIRRHLESLPLETFDSILILADEALEDSVVNADSRSLATLLLIRDIQSKRMPYQASKNLQVRHAGGSQSSWIREMQQASDQSIIISEILDSRTKNLVSVSKISDYVLSNELVSMALAMVAEDKQINRVLEELFAEEGNEMYIRPGEMYLYDQEELSFYDIMARARQRQEIVIGYRVASQDRAIINPPNKFAVQKWSSEDVFIVLAQEE